MLKLAATAIGCVLAWLPVSPVTAASPDQRIAAARDALVAADAAAARAPDARIRAVERLFNALDDAGQLETAEAQALVERDIALHAGDASGSSGPALALERQARLLSARRRIADADAAATRALSLIEQQRANADGVDEGAIRATLGIVRALQGKFGDGAVLLQDALARFDAHGLADRRTARALQWLAACDIRLQKWDDAQRAIDRAIALAATLDGADSAAVADDTVVAAYIPRYRGDIATAIGLLDKALPILRDATPRNAAAYARGVQALAELLRTSGEERRAEQLFRSGIAAEENAPSAGGYWLAGFLNGVGLCLVAQGQFDAATPYLEHARILFQSIYGAESRTSWILEGNLAITYLYTGRYDDSAALLRHVIEASDRVRPATAADITPSREKLATLDLWQGRYGEAEALFREYLAHAAADIDSVERNAGESMAGLSAALWGQGRTADAFAQAIAAEQWRQHLLRTTGATLAEHHAIEMRARKSGGLDWAIALAAATRAPAQIRAAWTLAVESRGTVSAISARRLALARTTTDAALRAAWDEWKQRDEALVQARLDAARNPNRAHAAALDAAEAAFDDAERALAHATGAPGGVVDRGQKGLAQVLGALPRDTLLVSYAETDVGEPGDLARLHESERHAHLFAFVARRGAAPDLIDLGARARARSAVENWLALITRRDSDPRARAAAGARVRERVWDPIAKRWPQRRVLLLPSALLERVPFAALTGADGRYMVEQGYAFHLLDHEHDVLAKAPAAGAQTLSLIGAPDFGTDSGADGTRSVCSGLRGLTFKPLPHAAREIDAIKTLWLQQSTDTAPPVVLAGADADEAHARAALRGSRIVHFATHGLFLDHECNPAAPDARGLQVIDTQAPAAPDAVDGISALVLTGANRAASTTENDGLLTSEEIATLDLNATDWAVLSACDTGIGTNVDGEGVFGLRRAFRMAGARSVVMSLWPVDDGSTADWMIALYRERLQKHASTMDAVRAAELAVIAQRRERGEDVAPYYWAAFVAAGDWR